MKKLALSLLLFSQIGIILADNNSSNNNQSFENSLPQIQQPVVRGNMGILREIADFYNAITNSEQNSARVTTSETTRDGVTEKSEERSYTGGYKKPKLLCNEHLIGAGIGYAYLGFLSYLADKGGVIESLKSAVIPSLMIVPAGIVASEIVRIKLDLDCSVTDACRVRFFEEYKDFKTVKRIQ